MSNQSFESNPNPTLLPDTQILNQTRKPIKNQSLPKQSDKYYIKKTHLGFHIRPEPEFPITKIRERKGMTLTQKIRIPNHILSQATDSLHSGKFMVIM